VLGQRRGERQRARPGDRQQRQGGAGGRERVARARPRRGRGRPTATGGGVARRRRAVRRDRSRRCRSGGGGDGGVRRRDPPRGDPQSLRPRRRGRLREQRPCHLRHAPGGLLAGRRQGRDRLQSLRPRHGLGAGAVRSALRPGRRGAPLRDQGRLRSLQRGRRAHGGDVPPANRDADRRPPLQLGRHRGGGAGAGGGDRRRSPPGRLVASALGLCRCPRRRRHLPPRGPSVTGATPPFATWSSGRSAFATISTRPRRAMRGTG